MILNKFKVDLQQYLNPFCALSAVVVVVKPETVTMYTHHSCGKNKLKYLNTCMEY